MAPPSPFVYWAQSESHIFLKADLKNVRSHRVTLEEDEVSLTAVGTGMHGVDVEYRFAIEFFLPIDKASSSCEVKEREVRFTLKKMDPDWWPRLLYHQEKLPWLKVDFDRWQDADKSSSDEEDTLRDRLTTEDLLRSKYPEVCDRLQRQEVGYIAESTRQIYLFCYNLFMLCGFLYVACVLAVRYFATSKQQERAGGSSEEDWSAFAYGVAGTPMKMLHLFMILEVLHPLFGYTRGSVLEAALQVGGRNLVLFALIDAEPRIQPKPVIFYLFCVYTAIELFRYPYYLLRVYNVDVALLTWLRYTLWIPLYPVGFVCEGVIALRDIPYFEETGKFSLPLPNAANLAFDFPSALRLYLLFLFVPTLYTMMNHMYQLRCKKLGIKQYPGNKQKKSD